MNNGIEQKLPLT